MPAPARAWVCLPDLTFLNVWGPVVRDRSTLDPRQDGNPLLCVSPRLAHLGTQGRPCDGPHPPRPPPQTCGPTASGAGPPGRRDQASGAGPRGRLAVPSQRRPGASRPFRHTEQNLRFQSPPGARKQWATGPGRDRAQPQPGSPGLASSLPRELPSPALAPQSSQALLTGSCVCLWAPPCSQGILLGTTGMPTPPVPCAGLTGGSPRRRLLRQPLCSSGSQLHRSWRPPGLFPR